MMLPVLPLIVPTVWIVVSCYANAWLYCLYDAYHASNRGKPAEATADTRSEDGEDSLDEAEFDTPDPESDIYVPNRVIFARSWRMLRNREPAAMSRSSNLLHALGNTTVLCAIDNEGTIIKPFPLPRQVFFLAEQPVTLDVQLLEDDNKRVVFSETDRVRYLSYGLARGGLTGKPAVYQWEAPDAFLSSFLPGHSRRSASLCCSTPTRPTQTGPACTRCSGSASATSAARRLHVSVRPAARSG